MDKKKENIVFFLKYWDRKNATIEEKTDFILTECVEWTECEKMGGEVYSNAFFFGKNPKELVKGVIIKRHPEWVIGVENTATLLLPYHRQKKILVNPKVTLNDLNWVTTETIDRTYAFFSADYEADYEIYSRVYHNAVFFPLQRKLSLSEIKRPIMEIVGK